MKTQRRAFSMVELMIVIVIVAILAAVATPILRGRLEKAKWSEAMAGCSAIATAIRTWAAENSATGTTSSNPSLADLGFNANDLDGKYFDMSDYAISNVSYDPTDGSLTFTITVTGDGESGAPSGTLTLTKADGSDNVFTLTSGSGENATTTTF